MTPVERVTAALEARGHTVKNGAARCPAHDDKSPSLSLSEGADGKALVKCHAGCSSRQIVEALNLAFTDLFPPKEDATVVVARYPYVDANGNVVVTVVRTSPKGFYREPKGITETPLYNLPNVLKAIAAGNDLWIVEGEKDVHTLARHGETATCNIGGAGKFTYAHAEQLRGAHTIYIVADNDPPGHDHARHIAELLPHDGVTLWQPATGKDISDHFAAGLTIHDLQPLEDDPATENRSDLPSPWICWPEFWAHEHGGEEWAIYPLIPKGRGVALYAPAKAGKSTILLAAAAAAATGRPIFGNPPQPPIDVAYVDLEMTEADLEERLEELGYGPDDNLDHLHYAVGHKWPPLDTQAGADELLAEVTAVKAEVVIVDTYGRAVQGDENDADTTRTFTRLTGDALKRAGVAWLRSDHSGKDLDLGARGSSAKAGDVDVVWRLVRLENAITITLTHSRLTWIPPAINLEKREDGDHVEYVTTNERGYVEGTHDVVRRLDELDAPTNISSRKAQVVLKESGGTGTRRQVLLDALRFRKTRSEMSPLLTGTGTTGYHSGTGGDRITRSGGVSADRTPPVKSPPPGPEEKF